MSAPQSFWGALATLPGSSPYITLAVSLLSIFFLSSFFGPLSKIPGPLIARYTPLWLLYHAVKGDTHRATIALHEKYGKVVRTGTREVSVSDLEAIKTIYGAGSKYLKSDFYDAFQSRQWDIFPERDDKKHAHNRKLITRFYSVSALREFEPKIDKTIDGFVAQLKTLADRPVDMSYLAQLFAFDVIGEVTFSKPFGYVSNLRDIGGTFSQLDSLFASVAWVGQVPLLYRTIEFLWKPLVWAFDLPTPIGSSARNGAVIRFTRRHVRARFRRYEDGEDSVDEATGEPRHRDFLAKFIGVHDAKPEGMPFIGVLSAASANVGAGSDTTAISISAVLYYLCRNRRCLDKLLEEIRTTRRELERQKEGKDGDLSGDTSVSTRNLSIDTTLAMPYLSATIHEALRLHPAVGFSLSRVVPPGGLHIAGNSNSKSYYLPPGTLVGANAWAVHRDKSIYGADADSFRPERWLEATPEQRSVMDRYFLAFGAGSRLCLGMHLSLVEIGKLVPRLVEEFDMRLAGVQEGEEVRGGVHVGREVKSGDDGGDGKDGSGIPEWKENCKWFVKQSGWRVVLRPRGEKA